MSRSCWGRWSVFWFWCVCWWGYLLVLVKRPTTAANDEKNGKSYPKNTSNSNRICAFTCIDFRCMNIVVVGNTAHFRGNIAADFTASTVFVFDSFH
jgi:hypothetical protein